MMDVKSPMGSSPHARGARGAGHAAEAARGIIPACAGSTSRLPCGPYPAWDHPRMRGEHAPETMESEPSVGSSPHARGAPAAYLSASELGGIIPACAGSTGCRRRPSGPRWDHPRMRGEHSRSASLSSGVSGSSPHARGARHAKPHAFGRNGIIPACAGSTPQNPCRTPPAWDHPRMRGEHIMCVASPVMAMGSSPHARGAHSLSFSSSAIPRIIPACAGSTPPRLPRRAPGRDHPRMRGEHSGMLIQWVGGQGSSPHARGAQALNQHVRRFVGIIPACAGSTVRTVAQGLLSVGSSPHARGAPGCRTTRRPPRPDHPRMRGEHQRMAEA